MATFLFIVAMLLAIRSLVSLILKRRDVLHGLLLKHVKEARAEIKKKEQIIEFRKRKRRRQQEESSGAENPNDAEPPAKAA